MPAVAGTYQENQRIDDLFRKEDVQGTFMVFDLRESSYVKRPVAMSRRAAISHPEPIASRLNLARVMAD